MSAGDKTFINDFAPAVINKTFTVNDIICGIRHGVFRWEDLKPEMRKAAQDKIDRQRTAKNAMK